MMIDGMVAQAITPPISHMIRRGLCMLGRPSSQPVNTVAPIPAIRWMGPVIWPASPTVIP